MNYLRLIRWPNVVMVVVTQLIIIYCFLTPSGVTLALNHYQVLLLTAATALITAGGNVINDIHDIAIDTVNRPNRSIIGNSISEDNAYYLYIAVTITGVLCGFLLSNSIDKPLMSIVFILVAFVLYLYATSLSNIILLGNIIVSLLVSLVVIVTVVFELYPVITTQNIEVQRSFFGILLEFSFFAFVINLVREWVKDCQDVDGDHAGGRSSLPLAIGRNRTAKIAAIVLLLFIVLLGWYIYEYLYQNQIAVYYFVFVIIGPLGYTCIQLWNADKKEDFKLLSLVLKITLLMGVLSMSLFYMF